MAILAHGSANGSPIAMAVPEYRFNWDGSHVGGISCAVSYAIRHVFALMAFYLTKQSCCLCLDSTLYQSSFFCLAGCSFVNKLDFDGADFCGIGEINVAVCIETRLTTSRHRGLSLRWHRRFFNLGVLECCGYCSIRLVENNLFNEQLLILL